jgi:exonuclease SbcC
MIPIKLTISGFLSYKERQEIEFDSFDIACISGANGSGKSSLLDAITWALFGQARKRDDSLINSQSKQAEVSYTFLYEGNTYRIQRVKPEGKSTILEFQIQTENGGWKALTDRTMRGTEALIEETLNLDYETFVNASFFLQGKADQFTQQRPADRKRILSNILGLEVWETYRKKTSIKRRAINSEITGLDGRLAEINQELDEEAPRKDTLKQLINNLKTISTALEIQKKNLEIAKNQNAALEEQKNMLEAFSGQLKTAHSNLSELKEKLTSRVDEKEEYQKLLSEQENIELINEEWLKTRLDLEEWDKTSQQFNQQEKLRRDPLLLIENQRSRLETEKNHLVSKEIEVDKSRAEKTELGKRYKDLEKTVKELENSINERDKIKAELDQAIELQAKAAAENPVLKEEMNKLKSRLDQLESHEEPDCPFCGKPLSPEERDNLIGEISSEGKELGDKFRENSKLLEKADNQVDNLKKGLKEFGDLDSRFLNASLEYDQTSVKITQIEEMVSIWEKEDSLKLIEITESLEQETFSPEAKLQLQKIDQELIKIGYDVETHDKVRKKESSLRSIEKEYLKLKTADAALSPLEREISDIKVQIEKQTEQSQKIDEEHNKLKESYEDSLSKIPNLLETEREMLKVQKEENILRQEVGAAQQKVNVLETLKTRKAELEVERSDLTINLAQYQELERAFGKDGVPALLIEQALPQIERKANEILQSLSGGDMTISFVTQKAYKDKKRSDLQETLELRIRDGRGERDYEMFSGGEAFRINFAVRLALSEVLSQRAGARLQTLVIDEGFGSQDEVGMQRLVYAINSIKDRFEKILVITHIDSLKEAFPTRIEVEKTNSGSVVNII